MNVKNFHITRHVHTTKNSNNKHGFTVEATLTDQGSGELSTLRSYVEKNNIKKIYFADTPQCALTAKLVGEFCNINSNCLNLSPFSLGKFSGLSEDELLGVDSNFFEKLFLFRLGNLSIESLDLSGLESSAELINRISRWGSYFFQKNSKEKSLIIGSSSVLTMIGNYVQNRCKARDYFNFQFPTGKAVPLSLVQRIELEKTWPRKNINVMQTKKGRIISTQHYASIVDSNATHAVIFPGAFGSSRLGPYALYTRIADSLARHGIATHTVDPLGSGESDQICRSRHSDEFSLTSIIEHICSNKIILIGHSTGANLINLFSDNKRIIGTAFLAPILNYRIARREIGFSFDRVSRNCIHHGVSVNSNVISNKFFKKNKEMNQVYYFCDADKYTQPFQFDLDDERTVTFKGGDHNFSTTDISNRVIEHLTNWSLSIDREEKKIV